MTDPQTTAHESSARIPADLQEAALALHQGRLEAAERLCRAHLARHPQQVDALRMLAEVAAATGALEPALSLLEKCLRLAPDYRRAHLQRVDVLTRLEWYPQALAALDILEKLQPGEAAQAVARATVLLRLGQYQQAAELYEELAAPRPQDAALRNCAGHAHKALGQTNRAVEAYRAAIAADPKEGEAWWHLANLKSYRFTAADQAQMRQALARPRSVLDAVHLHFALGRALEDEGAVDESFAHYAQGNAQARSLRPYDPTVITRHVDALMGAFTVERCAALPEGNPDPAPIFIVGLPRSGSTLVEHILGAHSQVDATKELPFIPALVQRLAAATQWKRPGIILDVAQANRQSLGAEYLARVAPLRHGAARFTDKLPNNFLHIGFIKAILPRAVFIDVRRDPMAAGFSCYKQLFASGHEFSYDLADIGRYTRDYLRLTEHWNRCFPGAIHTLYYEALVATPREEITRLLAHCGLSMENACLEPQHSGRAVATPSAEQVRQPIYRTGNDAWRTFESLLVPLRDALECQT